MDYLVTSLRNVHLMLILLNKCFEVVGESWIYPYVSQLSQQPEGVMGVRGRRGSKGSNSEAIFLLRNYE